MRDYFQRYSQADLRGTDTLYGLATSLAEALTVIHPAGPDTTVTTLTARPSVFTAAGQSGPAGQQAAAVWSSSDGTSWTRLSVDGLAGGGMHDINTLAPSGWAVAAIDSVLTQGGQEYISLLVPAH